MGKRCAGMNISPDDPPAAWHQSLERHHIRFLNYKGTVVYNSFRHQFDAYSALVVPPNARLKLEHESEIVDGHELHWDFVPSNDASYEVAVPLITPVGEIGPFLMDAGRRALARDVPGFQHFTAIMHFLLWHVSQPVMQGTRDMVVSDAEAYIRTNIASKLQVGELAEHLGVSQNTLIRSFRRHHGMPPQQFIRALRLQIAYEALVNTRTPIKEVAASVGIYNLQHFNHMVQDAYGLSPSKLRFSRTLPGAFHPERLVDLTKD